MSIWCRLGIIPGWETNCNSFTHGQLFDFWLKNYEDSAKRVFHDWMKTMFDYDSNMTEYNKNKKVKTFTCIQGSGNYTIDVWGLFNLLKNFFNKKSKFWSWQYQCKIRYDHFNLKKIDLEKSEKALGVK